MSEEKTSVDTWDGLLTNYLKAEHLEADEDKTVCIDVKKLNINGEERLELILNYKEEKYSFSMNKTNMVFLKEEAKLDSPEKAIGKIITFKKALAMNPQLKKEVPTLRIIKVE